MQNYHDAVQDFFGRAIPNATVTVTLAAGGAATLYSDNALTQLASNVLTTGPNGQYSFYATNGTYTLTVAATGYTTQVIKGVVLYDPADAVGDVNTSLQAQIASLTTSVNAGLTTKAPLTIADRQYHYGYDTPNQVAPNLTAKTVAASDCVPGSWYEYNNSAPGIVTLPDNAVTPIPIGAVFEAYQIGTGQFTVVGANANVSVLPAGVIQSGFQGAWVSARKRGTNVWVVNGNLASSAAPVNTVPPSISGGPAAGSVLTRVAGTWVGAPSPTVTGAWYKNGVTTGTTTSTYTTATPGDVGAAFTWVESASSTSGGPVTAISNVITMTSAAGGAPVGSAGTVVVTGSPVVNAVLSVNTGTWTNTPTSYAYAWYSNGVAIAGATASTFTVTTAQAGTNVYATVLATGAGGTALAALQSQTLAITGATPTTSASSAPSLYDPTNQYVTGVTLNIDFGAWANNPTFTEVWQRADANGNITTIQTNGTSYATTGADGGCLISCVITGTSTGGSVTVTTPAVAIAVSTGLPVNTVTPSVTPATGVGIGTLLTCAPGTWTNSPTFTYQWQRNIFINLGSGSTYTTVAGDNGQSVTCQVTATNAGLQQAVESNAVVPSGGVAGSLSISQNAVSSPLAIDSVGTVDWLMWPNSTTPNTKSGGPGLIANSNIGTISAAGGSPSLGTITWSGGTPTASGSVAFDGVQTTWGDNATGKSIVITLNGTNVRTFNVYAFGYNIAALVTATLSDGSAASVSSELDSAASGASTMTAFTISGNAASSSQTITVTVVGKNTNSGGTAYGSGQLYIQAVAVTA